MGVVSNTTTVTIRSASQLASAAATIGAGQWTTFLGPPTAIGSFGISWQSATAFWDANNREFQFMAKAQNGGNASHWIYSESLHAWRYTSLDVAGANTLRTGHIWNRGFDASTGDYFYADFGGQYDFLKWMKRSVEAGQGSTNSPWTVTSTAPYDMRPSGDSEETDIGFHPNLYGTGQPGIIFWTRNTMNAWKKSTDTWTLLQYNGGGDYHGTENGAGVYLPGYDRLVMGTGNKGKLMLVDAGSAGNLHSSSPNFPVHASPLRIKGSTSGDLPWGKLIVHPTNTSRLMILSAGSGAVYTNSAGGTAAGWNLESWTHPFFANLPLTGGDAGSWTCGSVSSYGVIWGMAYNGSTTQSILWKPNT